MSQLFAHWLMIRHSIRRAQIVAKSNPHAPGNALPLNIANLRLILFHQNNQSLPLSNLRCIRLVCSHEELALVNTNVSNSSYLVFKWKAYCLVLPNAGSNAERKMILLMLIDSIIKSCIQPLKPCVAICSNAT